MRVGDYAGGDSVPFLEGDAATRDAERSRNCALVAACAPCTALTQPVFARTCPKQGENKCRLSDGIIRTASGSTLLMATRHCRTTCGVYPRRFLGSHQTRLCHHPVVGQGDFGECAFADCVHLTSVTSRRQSRLAGMPSPCCHPQIGHSRVARSSWMPTARSPCPPSRPRPACLPAARQARVQGYEEAGCGRRRRR